MKPITEKRDVQDRIINYLQAIGWKYIPPADLNEKRGYDIKEPFILDILERKLKKLNKGIITDENVGDVIRRLKLIPSTFMGNKEFLDYLRGKKTVYIEKEKRERNFKLIDFENIKNNHFAFTKEFWFDDREKRRLDIVLFINGMPICDFELKSPTVYEAEEQALEQIRIYNNALPELFKYLQFYTLSEGIRLFYGPTWKYESKTFYRWKVENGFNFEKLVKSFFDREEVVKTLNSYIVFMTVDEVLQKYILKKHQRRAIRKIIKRVLEEKKKKGLIWHTQGSYKSLTMIVSADELRKIPELENPTIIVVIDRLELEQQIYQNFQAYGYPNIVRTESKKHLRELLESDYRGLIITTIHKFEGMPKHINERENIIVLIDEAHRSQEGDLGNYMRGSLPNAFYFGFTGTPIDKTKVGKGTFIAFGYPPDEPYIDKYAIDESIEDGTTIPLYYSLAKTELHVDKETLEEEFFRVVEEEGIASIEGINKIIERAEKLKSVLKAEDRIDKISKHIAEHYKKFVEPLGFKAFIVAVDREACALYKEAIDKYLPQDYTKVVYTSNYKDSELLKKYHISEDEEKIIRKNFKSPEKLPKILIVTEKLLTGYDAPLLYAMYLDKPLKDHTLLQAIARINRPYTGKTCGLIMDYVGIFENLQRALAFYSKDVEAGLIDYDNLKERFKDLMDKAFEILKEIDLEDEEKRIQNIIDYFFEEDKKEEYIKIFKQIQEIYEILSPDEFLRDYIEKYKLLIQIYNIIYQTYNPEVEKRKIRRDILKKTEELIKKNVELSNIVDSLPLYEINEGIASTIKADNVSQRVKVANLYRSINIYIEKRRKDSPYLVSIVEKVEEIISHLRERQRSVESALEELTKIAEDIVKAEEEQLKSGLSKEEFSYFWILRRYGVENKEMSKKIYEIISKRKHWILNENEERELRKDLYKVLQKELCKLQLNNVVKLVNELLEIDKIIRG
ncbi:HsdR family type I site-specific deoxyribonuclease [Methanothermococcus sp. SCGC AD-155-C09]|nr:HsdR family type I site-specific deoxyribonuclease [Methanothermococcus sp. SCGC AD-155-C09]